MRTWIFIQPQNKNHYTPGGLYKYVELCLNICHYFNTATQTPSALSKSITHVSCCISVHETLHAIATLFLHQSEHILKPESFISVDKCYHTFPAWTDLLFLSCCCRVPEASEALRDGSGTDGLSWYQMSEFKYLRVDFHDLLVLYWRICCRWSFPTSIQLLLSGRRYKAQISKISTLHSLIVLVYRAFIELYFLAF